MGSVPTEALATAGLNWETHIRNLHPEPVQTGEVHKTAEGYELRVVEFPVAAYGGIRLRQQTNDQGDYEDYEVPTMALIERLHSEGAPFRLFMDFNVLSIKASQLLSDPTPEMLALLPREFQYEDLEECGAGDEVVLQFRYTP